MHWTGQTRGNSGQTALAYFKMKKKGVIEMMETFIIIFVIFILIGFGMFFFFKFSAVSTKETARESCILDASGMLLSALSIPEIQCSQQGTPVDGCVDTSRLTDFKNTKKAGIIAGGACKKKIEFIQLYPEPEPGEESVECGLNVMRSPDFPQNCGRWLIAEPEDEEIKNRDATPLSTPVSLYYPYKGEYGLGKMIITVYTVR